MCNRNTPVQRVPHNTRPCQCPGTSVLVYIQSPLGTPGVAAYRALPQVFAHGAGRRGPGRWGAPNTDRFRVRHGVARGYASIAATCKRSVKRPSFTNSPAFVQGVNTGRAHVTLFISLYPTSADFSSTCRYVHYTSSAMWSPQLCYHTSPACHVTKRGKSCDKDHRILTADGV